MSLQRVPITVAYGDGIGPEIMAAALDVILEAGAQLDIERIEIGERIYERGFTSGIEPQSWDSLRRSMSLKKPLRLNSVRVPSLSVNTG